MARNCGDITGGPVDVHTVMTALAKKLDAVAFEVTDQIDPLDEMEARGSRITVLFWRDSSAYARLDSNTNWTAS